MSDIPESDKSYLNMLNNPTINPGPAVSKPAVEKTQNTRLKPSNLSVVQEAKVKLEQVTQDVYLSSESDEPFTWINTKTKENKLPSTVKELVQLGLLEEQEEHETLSTKTVQEFLQSEEYEPILKAIEQLDTDKSQVYLVGEESKTVLILCLVQKDQETALVGLKSLLVQT